MNLPHPRKDSVAQNIKNVPTFSKIWDSEFFVSFIESGKHFEEPRTHNENGGPRIKFSKS